MNILEIFVEKLASETVPPGTELTSINDVISKMDVAKAIRDKVMYFIQEASHES